MVVSVVSMGSLTMACSAGPDELLDPSRANSERRGEEGDDGEGETTAEKKSDTDDPVSTKNEKPKPEAPKSEDPDTGLCGGEDTNPVKCAACCAIKHNPITACLCGPGAECAAACGESICGGGKLPNLGCVSCVIDTAVHAQCDIGIGPGQDPKAVITALLDSELVQCIKGCGKP